MALLAFLVAVAYVPGLTSAAHVGRWSVLLVGVACLLRPSSRVTVAHWCGLALLAWCAVGLLWSYSPLDTLGGLLRLSILAGVFCVAAEMRDIDRVLVPLGLGVTVSTAFAVAQQMGWHPVSSISDHPVGLFLSKNGIAEVAMPVLVWSVLAKRWWTVPGALACVTLSGSKEVYLMAAAAMFVVSLVVARRRGVVEAAAVALMAVGIALVAMVVVATWPESSTTTLNERLEIWQVSLAAWWMQPWGWGLNTYGSLLQEFGPAHSEYVQLLFETGPIGVVLVVTLLVLALAGGAGLAHRAALASLCASAFVWWPVQQPASGFLVALLAGHLCGAGSRVELKRRAADSEGVRTERRYGAAEILATAYGFYLVAFGSERAVGAAAVRDRSYRG